MAETKVRLTLAQALHLPMPVLVRRLRMRVPDFLLADRLLCRFKTLFS